MTVPPMNPAHDCDLQHLQMPEPEILIPDRERRAVARYNPNKYLLVPHSYDPAQLARPIEAITGEGAEQTSRQLSLQYGFIVDYLSGPSTDEMTPQEYQDFLHSLMVRIDVYFFQGALTQGPSPYVRLIVYDSPHLNINGFYSGMDYIANRIVLYLRNSSTGERRLKLDLLTTLVHELVHAYLDIFFNFCEVQGLSDIVLANQGHGLLFTRILQLIYTHMRAWHASLLRIGDAKIETYASDSFISYYYGLAQKLPFLRDAWEVRNLRRYQPDIFRYWWWNPTRTEEFKRALLRLSYGGYTHFVSTRVPYPAEPYQLWLS
ncbi:hypothetical protein F5B21DRAFT_527703 [Xylaria acuta]|nr:hypothetical protein F5B21DRAFT_527703 [Xylaria acuta]